MNNTGQTWTDFHLELGFGVGAEFVRSSLSDLLDFDTPDIDPVATSLEDCLPALFINPTP